MAVIGDNMNDGRWLVLTVDGALTGETLAAIWLAIDELCRRESTPRVLVVETAESTGRFAEQDWLTQLTPSATTPDRLQLSLAWFAAAPTAEALRDIAFGETIARNRGLSMRLFVDRAAAESWLETAPAQSEPVAAPSRAAEYRLRQAQAAINFGIWDWEIATDKTTWSDELFRIYGILPEEFTGNGSDYFEYTHPEDRAKQATNIQRCFAAASDGAARAGGDGEYFEFRSDPQEFRVVRRDGTIRWVRGDAVATVDLDGTPLRMLGTLMDITEQKITEEYIHQTQKTEMIGLLASGLAHDFRNYFTIISGYLALAAQSVGDRAPTSSYLAEAGNALASSNRLADRLLIFARQGDRATAQLNLSELLSTMTAMVRHLVHDRVTVVTDFIPDVWVIMDAVQLEQTVFNLAVNGSDAMPNGGTLAIVLEEVLPDQEDTQIRGREGADFVVIHVTDTGSGIEPAVLNKIFDPFFTTKPEGKGTGLGLSICQNLIHRHGGFITVDSQLGEGTRFSIYLPRAPVSVAIPLTANG